MEERHEREQYFFDEETVATLAAFAAPFAPVATFCAPRVGERLAQEGVEVAVLDIDERFASVPGFRPYDLYRPEWLERRFGLIVCDPPFFRASLSQLFAALRTLAHNDTRQPLLLSYLKRREPSVLGTFAPFGLRPTGYSPGYRTVQRCARNDIEFYSNLPVEGLGGLAPP